MNIQDWIPYPENKPTRFGEYLVTLEYIYPSYRGIPADINNLKKEETRRLYERQKE